MQAHTASIVLSRPAPRRRAPKLTLFRSSLAPSRAVESATVLFLLLASLAPAAMLAWIVVG